MTYLKKIDGTKCLNTKQCPVELSPRIIPQVSPFLPKIYHHLMLLCYSHKVWTVLPSPEPSWETLGWRGISPNSQKYIHFPHQKNPRQSTYTSAIKKGIQSTSTSFICSCSHYHCMIFFNFRLSLHTCHTNFD